MNKERWANFTNEELKELESGLSWKDSEGSGEDLTYDLAKEICLVLYDRVDIEPWQLKRWGINEN